MTWRSPVIRRLDQAALDLGREYVRHAPWSAGKRTLVERHLNAALRDRPLHRMARTRFGATFAVDTQDLIQRYLYLFGVWEPHMTRWLQRRLQPGDVFVDVGANIGYYSVLASRLVGRNGKVVSVEASPAFHRILLRHAQRNGCANIRAVNAAVSDRDELLTFILASSRNMGANSIVPYDGPAESTFQIAARPLPALLTEEEITRARVIKIDVEGAEGGVVRGLLPLLGRVRPDAELTVEVTPQRMAELGESVDDLLDAVRAHGFHVYHLANDYAAGSYPDALRRAPKVPVRRRGPVTEESDLVFSRVDAETLP
ncbi:MULTISPECIES: FkbM family methyltransferase [Streptomyces]|uniref:FkbM family methyltransferase n=1 Tax=Streptomyces demainii TaxID=588122 RepID=A0ABT9KL07_9ACTN|nr:MULTISPECIES: FkbM family methyltransferase [Streptomyces]MBW8091877.1 FkbM family methyltransferase [Streptomyces hygroscopicus subsp. hygroscopicus]MCO8308500.1 FkbM family methyltransferase [Streptomyces sp. RKCA744]MDN3053104.1 FkbM family methyltransferase [Streptomyces sp. SRF1]MDP9609117.1 FkbM family methyltransferase [Streptomyces demainii]